MIVGHGHQLAPLDGRLIPALDHERLGEETGDALGGQELLEAGLADPSSLLDIGGAVGALGQPDRAGLAAEVTLVRGDAEGELREERGVACQKRRIAMGRHARDDLDGAPILEAAKGPDDVASVAVPEVVQDGGVCVTVQASEAASSRVGVPPRSLCLRAVDVALGRGDLGAQIRLEVGEDLGVGELVGQDGREADGQPGLDPFGNEVAEHVEQRQIRLGRCLVNPFLAVGPAACAPAVRDVTVQDDGERSERTHAMLPGS